jgi:hypothetical protein
LEGFVAAAGIAGSVQLWTGTNTPPSSDLPFGFTSWVLPGCWLLATVGLPAAIAGWLAYRRARLAPVAVLVAASTMLLEVLVQIPFIGLSWLQLVFGGLAVALGVLGVHARKRGWR